MQVPTDNQLRELAHKRVEFRTHVIVYLVINAMLWGIWYFTGAGYIWPIWPTAGWGVGLLFHYIFDYRQSRLFSEEEEFQRLKKKMDNRGHIAH